MYMENLSFFPFGFLHLFIKYDSVFLFYPLISHLNLLVHQNTIKHLNGFSYIDLNLEDDLNFHTQIFRQ